MAAGTMSRSTLVPFLYQTRTLHRFARANLDGVLFRQLTHTATLRSARATPFHHSRDSVRKRHEDSADGHRRHRKGDENRARAASWDEGGGDAEEEVIHPQKPQRNARKGWHKAPKRDANVPFELPSDLGVQEEPEEEIGGVQREPEDETGGKKSTITPTEKYMFHTIFEEIRDRKEASTPALAGEGAMGQGDIFGSFFEPRSDHDSEKSDPLSAQAAVNIIFKDAARHTFRKQPPKTEVPFEPLHPIGQTASSFDREKALLRFPPSLRKAARTAMNVFDPDVNDVSQSLQAVRAAFSDPDVNKVEQDDAFVRLDPAGMIDPLGIAIAAEVARTSARRKVESALKEAKNDFELWDLLEEHVFSMVDRFGIGQKRSEEAATAPVMKKVKKVKRLDKLAKNRPKPPVPEPAKLDMTIHGPLYPGYLLSALRMMDQKFSRTSPLALNILPRVKELGMASYLLGASTPFYNLLMEVQWQRYGDARAVLNLLEEMTYAGLYLDSNTKSLVHRMEKQFWTYAGVQTDEWEYNEKMAAEKHPFLFELMRLPDYHVAMSARLRHWAKTIDISIIERKRAISPERIEFQEDDKIPMEDEDADINDVEY